MTLAERIRDLRAAGGLALGLYLVPGYPDWESSLAAVRSAVRSGVAFIEFPVLSGNGWSERTGPTIARALSHAAGGLSGWSPRLAEWLSEAPHPVGIVYGGAWPEAGAWRAAPELLAAGSGLLLEDDPPDWAAYARRAAEWGAPLICAVDGRRADVRTDEAAKLELGEGFVYVSLGSRTGDRSAAGAAVAAKVEAVRERRPDLPVCCAFGIASGADLAEVRDSAGCDGAIVGTAAIEALEGGGDRFDAWLGEIVAEAMPREGEEVRL